MKSIAERPFRRLRVSQLELVCVLSETGTMRGASEKLHASPPALSKSLREVERFAGTALFVRSAQGMKATQAGEYFIQHARAILERIPELRDSARDAAGLPPPAMLRVGATPFVAWRLLPPALRVMAEGGAIPRIQVVEARIMALTEQLVHGELDAIVTLLTPEALEVLGRGSLALDQVRVERLFIVSAPGVSPRRTTWKKLAGRRWILPPSTYTARIFVQRAFLQAGILPPEPYFESNNVPATLELARHGLGIAPAFECTVREHFAAGSLCRVRAESEPESVPIGIASRKGTAHLAAIRSLREALQRPA